MSLSHDQCEAIKDPAVQIRLQRQPLKRVSIALEFVSGEFAVDYGYVDPNGARPYPHLFNDCCIWISLIFGVKPVS
jgi:hypothetical protein